MTEFELRVLIRQLQATAPKTGTGDPNGVEDGKRGAIYTDDATGDLYRKTTVLGTLTGWVTP